jgi:hypothetical protein
MPDFKALRQNLRGALKKAQRYESNLGPNRKSVNHSNEMFRNCDSSIPAQGAVFICHFTLPYSSSDY